MDSKVSDKIRNTLVDSLSADYFYSGRLCFFINVNSDQIAERMQRSGEYIEEFTSGEATPSLYSQNRRIICLCQTLYLVWWLVFQCF